MLKKQIKEKIQERKQEEIKQQVSPVMLQVNAQYIKDLSFEAPAMPFLDLKELPKVNINVNINVQRADAEQGLYVVDLTIKADAKIEDKTAYICELTYGTVVTVKAPEEHLKPLLSIEVPRLMFPFARSIIANTTRDAGMVPLMLSPIDFVALYRAKIAQDTQQQKES